MKTRLKRLLPWLPVTILAGVLFGGTARAAGHQPALDGLIETLKVVLSVFKAYLEAL